MIVIPSEIIAGVELEAMAVGVADIEEERIRNAVATGTALDVLQEAAGSHDIAEMQDVHRRRYPIGEVMQARALAIGDGEVVHIAFAMQPGSGDPPIRPVLLAIFGQPETEPCIEIDRALHLGREYVEMIEPLRMAALVEVVAPQQMRALVHRRIEFDLEAERIGELQRAALERLLGKRVGDAVLGKEAHSLVEIAFIADPEAEPVAGRRLRLAQHQRVMLMLLGAAQVHRLVVAVLDMEANSVFVEVTAGVQIRHVEHGVAGADDVERWIEDVCWYRHIFVPVRGFVSPSWRGGTLAPSRTMRPVAHPSRRTLARAPQDEVVPNL